MLMWARWKASHDPAGHQTPPLMSSSGSTTAEVAPPTMQRRRKGFLSFTRSFSAQTRPTARGKAHRTVKISSRVSLWPIPSGGLGTGGGSNDVAVASRAMGSSLGRRGRLGGRRVPPDRDPYVAVDGQNLVPHGRV